MCAGMLDQSWCAECRGRPGIIEHAEQPETSSHEETKRKKQRRERATHSMARMGLLYSYILGGWAGSAVGMGER